MIDDPIPTLRRVARWSVKALPVIAMVLVAVIVIGILGALSSRNACRRATCRMLEQHAAEFGLLPPEWLSNESLKPVAWPVYLLNQLSEEERQSIFAPRVAYKVDPPRSDAEDRPTEAWGYVRCHVPLPFVVRAHFEYVYSKPVEPYENLSGKRITRSGMWNAGVVTYLCAFGAAIPINHWGTGQSY